jgi:hypothetical protein
MRRTGNPSVVTRDGKHHLLSRVEFSDRRLAEDFLQESLHRSPQILPVEEIDPAFSPLVSLGREIDSIDNLFISPAGKITLVETKLWRNPEATREVVAQVLDYATRLSSWSYSGLENAVRNAQPPAPIGSASLYDFIAKKYPREVLPEEQFIDEVQKNLRATRFLLLVVGDGIRENLEKMLGHLHKHPQMLFTFCLVEIQIYENSALFDGRLLMPMLVAQTTEIVRAVVRVETTGQAQVSVAIAEENESKGSAGRRTLSEDIFFSEIQDERTKQIFRHLLTFASEIGAELTWRSSAVSIQLPDPKGSRQNLTLFVLTTGGDIYPGWLAGQLERVSLDKNISFDFVKALASMFPGITPHKKNPDSLSRAIKASELEPKVDGFTNLVRETVRKIEGKNE